VDIARFGEKKIDLLRRFRPFRDGTPSHDHLGDIFASAFWMASRGRAGSPASRCDRASLADDHRRRAAGRSVNELAWPMHVGQVHLSVHSRRPTWQPAPTVPLGFFGRLGPDHISGTGPRVPRAILARHNQASDADNYRRARRRSRFACGAGMAALTMPPA
jgi:hypothetical protein